MVSVEPPGTNPTIARIGLEGKACPAAPGVTAPAAKLKTIAIEAMGTAPLHARKTQFRLPKVNRHDAKITGILNQKGHSRHKEKPNRCEDLLVLRVLRG
jgi:hypothetical protein